MLPEMTIEKTTAVIGADASESRSNLINNILDGIMILSKEERDKLLSKYKERNDWNDK